MSDIFNFDSNKFLFLNNENYLSDAMENDLEDIEMGFKFNYKADHSEIEPNLLKVNTDATSEFERLYKKSTSNGKDTCNIPSLEVKDPQQISISSVNIYNNSQNNYLLSPEVMQQLELNILNNNLNNNFLMNFCQLREKLLEQLGTYRNYGLPSFRKFSDEQTRPSSHKNSLEMKDKNTSKKTGRNENSIFTIEKIKKTYRKREDITMTLSSEYFGTSEMKNIDSMDNLTKSDRREVKKGLKLLRNRLSAQKSRQKKKAYISNLEKELEKTKEELNFYKNKCNNNFFDNGNISSQPQHFDIDNQIYKDQMIINIFKQLIKTVIPNELQFIERKILKIQEIKNLESLNNFLETIVQSQIE